LNLCKLFYLHNNEPYLEKFLRVFNLAQIVILHQLRQIFFAKKGSPNKVSTQDKVFKILYSSFRFFIPRVYEETARGERFLQYDNDNGNRILIFGTPASIEFLENCQHWFMDGTFKTVPTQFMQLFTIHGLQRGHNVLCAYSLLRWMMADGWSKTTTEVPT